MDSIRLIGEQKQQNRHNHVATLQRRAFTEFLLLWHGGRGHSVHGGEGGNVLLISVGKHTNTSVQVEFLVHTVYLKVIYEIFTPVGYSAT